MTAEPAISTEAFLRTLGVNTHLDFGGAYGNTAQAETDINYLGLTNLRDSPSNPGDIGLFQQVAQATGAKFDAYIGETSPGGMSTELGYIQQLAHEGIVNLIEGGNEEDDAFPVSLGNSMFFAAQFQQDVFAAAQSLGLPTINMSFGAGWTAANGWIGDYGAVGDLSATADYANGHVYPQAAPDASIQMFNRLAHLTASTRPVINTEFGYDTNSYDRNQVAKWTLDATLDAIKDGDVKTYFYALYDDMSGAFGVMNPDGSPKPAGFALHNLTTLLRDGGGAFAAGSLAYTIDNTSAGDNSLLMEKSDGSYWLALWNESNGGHSVTLNLVSTAAEVDVFDPLGGTSAVQSASNTASVQVTVPDHPVLVEINPSGFAPPPTGAGSGGGGTPTSGSGMSIASPASVLDTGGQTIAPSGVSLSDAYALNNVDAVSVTITDQGGTISAVDAWGNAQQGSGAAGLTLSGTIWQVNAGLANLQFSGGADTVTISASDAAGYTASASIAVNGGSGGGQAGYPPPAPGGSTITIDPGDANPVVAVNSSTINASAGDHMIFIAGTGDVLTATGGTESVQAYQGGNSIATGAGDDTIRIAGSGNTIDAGGGTNQIADSGAGNTIVLPGAGQGFDNILGWVMQNGEAFDLRPALAGVGWNGDAASIGSYVQVSMSGNDATVSAGGQAVAMLNDAGAMNLSTLLAHAVT